MSKTILITGASSGFGRLTAETLAKSGYKVFAGFRSLSGSRKQVADEMKSENIELVELDVTSQASVDNAVATLIKKSNGHLDVVINNAGMASAGISETFSPEQVREMFDVNVFGIQRMLRATLPILRAQHSGLVNQHGCDPGQSHHPVFRSLWRLQTSD